MEMFALEAQLRRSNPNFNRRRRWMGRDKASENGRKDVETSFARRFQSHENRPMRCFRCSSFAEIKISIRSMRNASDKRPGRLSAAEYEYLTEANEHLRTDDARRGHSFYRSIEMVQ